VATAAHRVPTADLKIQQMEDAHAAIAEAVEKVQTVRTPWRTSAGPELAAQLIAATEDLSARVDTHLEDEEQNILPLINQHITADEWKRASSGAKIGDKPDITAKRRIWRPAQKDTAKVPKRPNSGSRPYAT
jgi:hemerythrin-like domain-containing protein